MKKREMKPKGRPKPPSQLRKMRMPTSVDVFISLAEAVVDGTLTVPIGGGVAFVRGGAIHRGWIHSCTETHRGTIVDVWDESDDQFFSFSLRETLPDIRDTGDRRRVNPPTKMVPSRGHEEETYEEPGGGGPDEAPQSDVDDDAGSEGEASEGRTPVPDPTVHQ